MKVKNLKKQSDTDWERLSIMKDEEINLSDNPELDDSFFANATIRIPEPKKSVSLRIDPDVLEWYRHKGPGYQSRMNAVLRMYMHAKSGVSRKISNRRGALQRKFNKTPKK